ncbi:MAG: hypothetical protein AAGL24_05010 [Pseudomonadota bacterium]
MGRRILSLRAAGLAALVTLSLASTASAITYTVNRTVGSGSVTGFIETDGTIGVLQEGNIVDWEITIASPNVSGGPPDTFGATGNTLFIRGISLIASAADISFNFDTDFDVMFFLKNQPPPSTGWCLGSVIISCTSGLTDGHEVIALNRTGGNDQLVLRSGTIAIATAVAPVPVPPAIAFMSAVFGGLGLLGFRRRNR